MQDTASTNRTGSTARKHTTRLDTGWLETIPRTLEWVGGLDGGLRLIDQTRLPLHTEYRTCATAAEVWEAIKVLRVRGAPAIGVAAAYGFVLGMRAEPGADRSGWLAGARRVHDYLASSRPTAVNLFWALRRMLAVAEGVAGKPAPEALQALLDEADQLWQSDAETCRRIGEYAADLIPEGGAVLTHCNAGALATVAYGTALAGMYVAHERGRRFRVFADETRPLLQGGRLTAYELQRAGIDVTVLCDNAAAALLAHERVDLVLVGADRIAANGDTANKIGTYGLALLAAAHGVPFYVAAPLSTFDMGLTNGGEIPIEFRGEDEVRRLAGAAIFSEQTRCYTPAFDVTPARLITGIVTEKGLSKPVTEGVLGALFT